jgi:hypothetical protein
MLQYKTLFNVTYLNENQPTLLLSFESNFTILYLEQNILGNVLRRC